MSSSRNTGPFDKPSLDALELLRIFPLEAMRGRRQWCGFKIVPQPDGKKPKKIPVVAPTASRKASSTAPATWSTFDDAICGLVNGVYTAVGYALAGDVVGIDLDGDRWITGDGKLTQEAHTIVDRCGSYAEQSISGKGLHILVGGKLPGTGRGDKTVGVEIYATGRLFIVTGRQLDGTPKTITENQATIGYLLRTYFDTQAGPTETTEKTEDMTSVTSATSDTSAVSDHSIVSTFSISSAHSVFSVPSAISVDDIIAETLPKGQGERNECVFNLARGLKFEAGMVNAKFPELKLVVRRWHDQAFATIGTKDFDETWSDFIRAWGVAKVPLHADVVTWALEKAKTGPLPPQAADYDSEMVRFLVGTCFHLASCHPEGRFFLSSHLAGEKLGVTHDRALRSLRMLCADEVIAVVEHGNARWATRYRWMPPVEQGPVSLANSRTGGEAQKNENRATSGLNSNG